MRDASRQTLRCFSRQERAARAGGTLPKAERLWWVTRSKHETVDCGLHLKSSLHAFPFTYNCYVGKTHDHRSRGDFVACWSISHCNFADRRRRDHRPVCLSTLTASQTVPGVEDRAHLWCGRLGCSYAWSLAKPTIAAPVHRPSSIHNPPSVDPVPGRLDHRVRLPHRYVDHSTSG